MDSDVLRTWRHQFDTSFIIGNPLVSEIKAVTDVADRLRSFLNHLPSFLEGDADEKRLGLSAATMATDFGCKILDQYGITYADGPTPKPLNLHMAETALRNIVAIADEYIGFYHEHSKLQPAGWHGRKVRVA